MKDEERNRLLKIIEQREKEICQLKKVNCDLLEIVNNLSALGNKPQQRTEKDGCVIVPMSWKK